jgi:hypothetical protein
VKYHAYAYNEAALMSSGDNTPPTWLVTNNTDEQVEVATFAPPDGKVATTVIPANGVAKTAEYNPPLMGLPNGKGFTFLKPFDMITVYKTWRGKLPSGKPYVALNAAVTSMATPTITTALTIDPDGAYSAVQSDKASRISFIVLVSLLGACFVAAIIVAIVVVARSRRRPRSKAAQKQAVLALAQKTLPPTPTPTPSTPTPALPPNTNTNTTAIANAIAEALAKVPGFSNAATATPRPTLTPPRS